MKNLVFALLAGSITTLAAANGAYAQNTVSSQAIEPQVQKNVTGNENMATAGAKQLAEQAAISPKALKNFTKAYKGVSGESWEKIDGGFSAKFVSNDVHTRIYFDKKGNWDASLKGYTEDKMPRAIRNIVKREYFDYTITYVQEVETLESKGIPTYVIHMEDSTSIKLLRVHDGEMSEWKSYKKQS
ncbi:MAG: hypothetical protein JWP81_3893 [Ferruginibacter sp.]|nr:hypothetical protein [Ferruginibacter sp.]